MVEIPNQLGLCLPLEAKELKTILKGEIVWLRVKLGNQLVDVSIFTTLGPSDRHAVVFDVHKHLSGG